MKKKYNKFIFDRQLADQFWLPIDDNFYATLNIPTDSWFDLSKTNTNSPTVIQFNKNKQKDIFVTRTQKIKVFPTPYQKNILLDWITAYRYMYNATITYTRKHEINDDKERVKLYNFNKLRKIVNDIVKNNKQMYDWIKIIKIPQHTLDNAINDVCKAFKSALTNKQKGNIKDFKLRYKKESTVKQTILLEASCFQNNKFKVDALFYIRHLYGEPYKAYRENKNTFSASVMGDYIQTSESIKDVNTTSRLTYNKNTNEFMLFVPYEKSTENIENREKMISLDSGKRTFQTGYGMNEVLDIGHTCIKKLDEMVSEIKTIKETIKKISDDPTYKLKIKKTKKKKFKKTKKKKAEEKSPKKKRKVPIIKKYKKQLYQKQRKLTNRVDDLHFKTCNYLCNNYDIIVIGRMNVQSIVSKKNKTISQETKESLLALRQYEFRTRLESKCEERGVKYYDTDEADTTRTCGCCGGINNKVGGAEIYECRKCKMKIGRDYNGARNILLKIYETIKKDHKIEIIQ
ncbi:MAG: transposase [Edafosvirus sp.]|uniref:Transposase n=1 Tax=Edafosvirus sp. TaxID=2487765 RepID=A0A3G4ZSA1_9VIRU|nr:MAG: transposase [Edafosvirus sp.]